MSGIEIELPIGAMPDFRKQGSCRYAGSASGGEPLGQDYALGVFGAREML
jgi:hypothetical protein